MAAAAEAGAAASRAGEAAAAGREAAAEGAAAVVVVVAAAVAVTAAGRPAAPTTRGSSCRVGRATGCVCVYGCIGAGLAPVPYMLRPHWTSPRGIMPVVAYTARQLQLAIAPAPQHLPQPLPHRPRASPLPSLSGSGASRGGPNSAGGLRGEKQQLLELVGLLSKRAMLPVAVFCFSKKRWGRACGCSGIGDGVRRGCSARGCVYSVE